MILKIFARQFLLVFNFNVNNIVNLLKFYKSYFKYKKISNIKFSDIYACLGDDSSETPFEPHYFYQGAWCIKKILKKIPIKHVDVGSDLKFIANLSQIVPVDFIDIRPFKTDFKNLKVLKGTILKLPYKNSTLNSVSCLHVAEHIGLGRYGDELDPDGTKKACYELSRVLKRDGKLYFSVPIGKERECFNAHRIFNPNTILGYFKNLKLIEFSVVDDNGRYFENAKINGYVNSNFSLGLFIFTK
jgi:SAM-dependent methyltransferase